MGVFFSNSSQGFRQLQTTLLLHWVANDVLFSSVGISLCDLYLYSYDLRYYTELYFCCVRAETTLQSAQTLTDLLENTLQFKDLGLDNRLLKNLKHYDFKNRLTFKNRLFLLRLQARIYWHLRKRVRVRLWRLYCQCFTSH